MTSRTHLAATAATALIIMTTTANAAPFEFRGFYAGAFAGYSDMDAEFTTGTINDGGTMGGLLAGYNFLNGNIVWGAEGDFALFGANPNGSCPYNVAVNCEVDIGLVGTLRARLGYAMDDWLIYATGGAAAGRFDLDTDIGAGSTEGGLYGWTVGAGIEYLIGDIVGLKLEYRYMQFGDFKGIERELEDATGEDIEFDSHVIMGGINFHF